MHMSAPWALSPDMNIQLHEGGYVDMDMDMDMSVRSHTLHDLCVLLNCRLSSVLNLSLRSLQLFSELTDASKHVVLVQLVGKVRALELA